MDKQPLNIFKRERRHQLELLKQFESITTYDVSKAIKECKEFIAEIDDTLANNKKYYAELKKHFPVGILMDFSSKKLEELYNISKDDELTELQKDALLMFTAKQ